MKTISKVMLVPVVAVGLLLSGLSFDAVACSNGLCSLNRTFAPQRTTRIHHVVHHYHYATWWGGCGCGCGCDCGCGCCGF